MEILVAIIAIALIAAIAYIVMQRSRGGAPGLGRSGGSPLPPRSRSSARRDPMAAAVQEHAQATDPHDVVVAEQRLQAQASQVSAGMQANAHRSAAAEHQRAADQFGDPAYADPAYDRDPAPGGAAVGGAAVGGAAVGGPGYDPASSANYPDPHADGSIDPVTGQRVDGYDDPNNDPRLDDPRYDGRLAADYDPDPDNQRR